MIPTSNHNSFADNESLVKLYIFWFLHQTTTVELFNCRPDCCISFDSYIKPQLLWEMYAWILVVYLLIPTSNHNLLGVSSSEVVLYIFWFLHQTTTYHINITRRSVLYIFWFLHQTTTLGKNEFRYIKLYIFWFLHQTTTVGQLTSDIQSCISFDSYIKPQLDVLSIGSMLVVYLLIPTSNHNWYRFKDGGVRVVYLLIPTSNHNGEAHHPSTRMLYIFWFLHQTTTQTW